MRYTHIAIGEQDSAPLPGSEFCFPLSPWVQAIEK